MDTGITSSIGERLSRVKEYLKDEPIFLANYSDGLTDMNLAEMVCNFKKNKSYMANFIVYQPVQSFHVVKLEEGGNDVSKINSIGDSGLWLNVGYFIFRKEIFDYIHPGEDLVEEPFQKLIQKKKLLAYPYNGFWRSMDTFKDKQVLDDNYNKDCTPWEVWKTTHVNHNNTEGNV